MRKKVLIIPLLCLLTMTVSAQLRNSLLVNADAGVAWQIGKTPVAISPSIGGGAAIGVGYELGLDHWIGQIGMGARLMQTGYKVENTSYRLEKQFDSQNVLFDYLLDENGRRDKYTSAILEIPLLTGGRWNQFYFLLGAKCMIPLRTDASASARYTARGDYEPYIDIFGDMPNHQFFTNQEGKTAERYHMKVNVAVHGEIGVQLGQNVYRRYGKVRPVVRLALAVDYGILDMHTAGDKEMLHYTPVYNSINMSSTIVPTNYLSTRLANATRPLIVGLKLTYLLEMREDQPCMICHDDYAPRHNYRRKCKACQLLIRE